MPTRIEVSRNLAIWTVVGVCALSAAIGSGITLIAETGPAGPAGAKGERGATGALAPKGRKARSTCPTSASSNPNSKTCATN